MGPLVRVFVPVNGCASVTLSHIRDIRRDIREAACDKNTLAAWHYFQVTVMTTYDNRR